MGNGDLRDAINKIVNSQYDNKSNIFFCRVIAIDTLAQTFTAQNLKGDTADILEDCQINVGAGNNIVSMPAVDSQVLLIRDNSDNSYYMIKQDEISTATVSVTGAVTLNSTISVDVDTPIFRVNNNYPDQTIDCEVVINDGTNGGMTNTPYLAGRLEQLENALKNWELLFLNWFPVARDGGLALKTLFVNTRTAQPLSYDPGTTVDTDLEDQNVKH